MPWSGVQIPWNPWTYKLCIFITHDEKNKTAHMIFFGTFLNASPFTYYLLTKGKKYRMHLKQTQWVKKAGKTNTDRTEKEVKLGKALKNDTVQSLAL